MNNKLYRKLITIVLIVILSAVFAATTNSFLSLRNFQMLLKEAAYLGFVAVGASFVMVAGGIDLSSGGIICLSGIVCARLSDLGLPGIVVLLGTVLAAAVCGAINGLVVTKLQVSDFIATLASGFVFSGMTLFFMYRDDFGRILSNELTNKSFLAFGGHVGGFYYITIAWIVITVIVYIIQTKFLFGTHLMAIGSNAKSSEMSGIKVERMRLITFVLAGLFCGFAAVFTVAYQRTTYLELGGNMGFQAVASCVIGGIILGGGKGDSFCAALGAFLMTLILNGIYKLGLSTAWQYLVQGCIILIAIMFDALVGFATHKKLELLSQGDAIQEAVNLND